MAEKILIVDDDVDTLRLVGLMLQRQGYSIVAAGSGKQALEMAPRERPDLILMDVMMPELDGMEVTRRLRLDPFTQDLPIILFTAKAQVEDKVEGFEAGADAYLTKPTQPRELFAQVKAVLARSAKARAPSAPTASLEKGTLIGVLAARGGLGVTTLALNLSIALHDDFNKDVILAEYRPGQGTLSLELGYTRADGLNRLLTRNPIELDARTVESELVQRAPGLRLLLASPQPRDAQYGLAGANFEALTRCLARLGRFIVLDLGSSLTPANERVLRLCDQLLVVVEPAPHTLVQSRALLEDLTLKDVGDGRVSVVLVNRVRSGLQLSWTQVQEQLGSTIGMVFTPAPELAYQASINHIPMVVQQPESLTAQQFVKLAEKVVQQSGK